MLVYLQMIQTESDRSKFEEIYELYRDIMYAVAYKVLNNEHDAEDIVHHAFVKIAENITIFSDSKNPKTKSCVIIITKNTAIDLYRRRKKFSHIPHNDHHVGDHYEYTGTMGLARCIDKLPLKAQQILILRYHHGYSTKEIAGIMNLSVHNVYKTEERAKEKLKALCEEAGIL